MLGIRNRCWSISQEVGDEPQDLVVVRAFDIPTAWSMLVQAVLKYGITQKVQDYDVDAKTVYNLVLSVARPETRPLSEERASCSDKFIQQYFLDYFYMPGQGEGLEHSYGDRLQKPFNQFEKVAQMLKDDPWTRRAVMLIARPEDLDSKYPPCIRELNFTRPAPDYGVLLNTVFVRSWDVFGAGNPDLGSFQLAAEHVAKMIGVPTGRMTVLATNAHIYRKGLKLIEMGKMKEQQRKRKRPWVRT